MMIKKAKNILLVEDEVLIAIDEQEMLNSYGYNVTLAANAKKAIDITTEQDSQIELVLMDIDLGRGLDGTQAAAEILKHKEIPILFESFQAFVFDC